ncbi:MAG: hypothetical protein ABL898_12550 [Hyphomicrobiaceae bacterium]
MNDSQGLRAQTRWPGWTLRIVMQLAVVVVTTVTLGTCLATAQGKPVSIVDTHQYRFHDACFIASVASAVETASRIDVRLATRSHSPVAT